MICLVSKLKFEQLSIMRMHNSPAAAVQRAGHAMDLSLQKPLPTHIPKVVISQDQTAAHNSDWAGQRRK